MDALNNSTTAINLLLNHIISTFNAKIGMLWIAGTDSFYTSTHKCEDNTNNLKSLVSYLAGYYHRFMKLGNKESPVILENLASNPSIPENLIKLTEIEKINTVLISPILHDRHLKGTLILGSDNVKSFYKIDSELLRLLSDVILNFEMAKNSTVNMWERVRNSFGTIVSKSQAMQEIYKTILKISQSDANVFIYGEKGTGKELIARTIYSHSKRQDHAFIRVDCVALPESLLESELFGYEKDPFTRGNKVFKRGLLELADEGTLFFEEITEVHMDLQAKLLRILQGKPFRSVGEKKPIDVDLRIISATTHDSQIAISKKILLEDLFYRLNVIPIFIPPLRERREDIPLLVDHFAKDFSKSYESTRFDISEEAMAVIMNYNFPGNVRELRNLIKHLILTNNEIISIENLPEEIVNRTSAPKVINSIYPPFNLTYMQAKKQHLMNFETIYFSQMLDKFHGNISRVAKEAKVSRKTIYNILQKNGLQEKRVKVLC